MKKLVVALFVLGLVGNGYAKTWKELGQDFTNEAKKCMLDYANKHRDKIAYLNENMGIIDVRLRGGLSEYEFKSNIQMCLIRAKENNPEFANDRLATQMYPDRNVISYFLLDYYNWTPEQGQ